MTADAGRWPALPLEAWADTCATLHMWTQIDAGASLAQWDRPALERHEGIR